MRKKRKKQVIPLRELWTIQKELTGGAGTRLSILELANIIASYKGWPEIVEYQHKYREFAKQYILKYIDERDRVVSQSPVCWVYFIQQGERGPVKIGVADNIENRLKMLQTGSAFKLELVAKIGCSGRKKAYDLEAQLHNKFKAFRLEGEWFTRLIVLKLNSIKEKVEWAGGQDIAQETVFNAVVSGQQAIQESVINKKGLGSRPTKAPDVTKQIAIY